MSREIDEKIVSMRLDNSDFEKNAEQSLSTLEKIKEKLHFRREKDGFDGITEAAEENAEAIEKAGRAYTFMQAKADAAAQIVKSTVDRATNAVIDLGKNLKNTFMIQPVRSGLSEYETQIGSIQTILANTAKEGTTLSQVNTALDELNTYADKTIYNFTQMTKNIGTFTAAGVKLNTSVGAIKGIANLAAVSGSTSTQASTAMYQLSQALATGQVKLQDWNSVVNAGMGGQTFQDALKRTAIAMERTNREFKDSSGEVKHYREEIKKTIDETSNFKNAGAKGVSDIITASGSFRDSLTQGKWLTMDVLLETLNQFAGVEEAIDSATLKAQGYTEEEIADIQQMAKTAEEAATKVRTFTQLVETLKEAAQSGWTQTWEYLLGDFERATKLFTTISDFASDILGSSAERRNKAASAIMLNGWEKVKNAVAETGVSGELYEERVIKYAKDHGVEVDKLIKKYGSFNESLQEGWLDTKLAYEGIAWLYQDLKDKSATDLKDMGISTQAVKNLKQMTKDAKEYKLPVVETKPIVDLLYNVKDRGGWNILYSSLNNFIEGLRGILDSVNKVLDNIYAKVFDSERFIKVFEWIEKVSEKFKNKFATKEDAENVKKTATFAERLADAISRIYNFLKSLVKSIFSPIKFIGSLIKNVGASIFDWISKALNLKDKLKIDIGFLDWLDRSSITMESFADNVDKAIEAIKKWREGWKGNISSEEDFHKSIEDLINSIRKVFSPDAKDIDFDEWDTKVRDFFTGLFGKNGSITTSVKNFFVSIGRQIGQNVIFKRIKSSFVSAFDKVKGYLDTLFANVSSSASNAYFELSTYISNLLHNKIKISEFFASIRDWFKKIDFHGMWDGIKSFWGDIKGGVSNIGDFLKNLAGKVVKFIDTIHTHLTDLGLGNIAAILFGIASLLGVKEIGKFGDAVGQMSETVQIPLMGIAGVLAELKDTLAAYQRELNASAFKEIAEAVAILAASMWAISKIPDDKFMKSAGVLGGMLAALLAINTILGLVNKKMPLGSNGLSAKLDKSGLSASGSTSVATNMWMLSRALVNITKAFKNMIAAGIPDMPWDKIGKMLVAMGAALLEVGGLMVVIGKLSGITIGQSIATLITSLGIEKLMDLFDRIASFDPSKVTDNLESFGVIYGLIAATLLETRLASPNAFSNSLALIVLEFAINVMASTMKRLAKIDWSIIADGAKKVLIIEGLLALWEVIDAIISFIRGVGEISGHAGSGKLFIGLAFAIYALAVGIEKLSDVDKNKLDKAVGAMSKILLSLTGIMAAAHDTGKAWTAILALTAFLSVFTIAMSIMSTFGYEQVDKIDKVTNSLVKVISSLALVLHCADTLGKDDKSAIGVVMGLFAEVAILIGVLSLVVKDTSNLDTICRNITRVMEAIAAIVIALRSNITKKVGNHILTFDKKDVGLMAALITVVTVLTIVVAAALMGISNAIKDAKKFEAVAKNIGIVMGVIGSVTAIIIAELPKLSLISTAFGKGMWISFGLIAGLMSVVAALTIGVAAAFTGIANKVTDAKKFESVGNTISIAMGVIGSVTALLLAMMPLVGTTNWTAIATVFGVMVGFVATVVLIMEGIGVLWRKYSWFKENIEAFVVFMIFIAWGLGRARDAYYNIKTTDMNAGDADKKVEDTRTFAEKIEDFGAALEKLSGSISNSATSLTGLFAAIGELPPTAEFQQQVKVFAQALSAITWAGLKSVITDWIANGLEPLESDVTYLTNFSNSLFDLAATVWLISEMMKDKNIDIEKLSTLSEAFSTLTSIDISNGDQKGAELAAYGFHLKNFAQYLSEFYTSLSGVYSIGRLDAFATDAKLLAEAGSLISGKEYLEGSFKNLGKGLEAFATSLKRIHNTFAGIEVDDNHPIGRFCKALDMLVESTNKIDKMGGLWGVVVGNNDPETFAEEIEKLGQSIATLDKVGSTTNFMIHMKNISDAIDILTGINFPQSGTNWLGVAGNMDTESFGIDSMLGSMKDTVGSLTSAFSLGDNKFKFGDTNVGSDITAALDEFSTDSTADFQEKVETAKDQTRASTNDILAFVTVLENFASAMNHLNTVSLAIDLEALKKIPQAINILITPFFESVVEDANMVGPVDPAKSVAGASEKLQAINDAIDLSAFVDFGGNIKAIGESLNDMEFLGSDLTKPENIEQFTTAFSAFAANLPTNTPGLSTLCGVAATDGFGILLERRDKFTDFVSDVSDAGKDIVQNNINSFMRGFKEIGYVFDGTDVDWDKVTGRDYDAISDAFDDILSIGKEIDVDPEQATKLEAVGTNLADLIIQGANLKVAESYGVGALMGDSFYDGARNSLSSISSKFDSIFSTMLTKVNPKAKLNGKIIGKNMGKGLIDGLNERNSDIHHAMSDIISGIKNTYSGDSSDTFKGGKKIGESLMEGLKAGINGKALVTVTFASQVDKTIRAGAATAQTASPSKRTMQLGAYLSEGLAIGIMSGESGAVKASAHLAGSAIDTIYSTLSSVSSDSNGNPNYDLRISPVVDLEKTRQGISTLSSDINRQAQTVSADVTTATRAKVAVEFENAAAIKNLSKQLTSMAENTASEEYLRTIAGNSRKQIYLNGRALVGELAPDIDETLGRRTMERLRRS